MTMCDLLDSTITYANHPVQQPLERRRGLTKFLRSFELELPVRYAVLQGNLL